MKQISPDTIDEAEILVEITEPGLPCFEFIVLPGLRSYPPELCEITTQLCKKYLQDKNSIILCVIPAITTRLTACQSIALIQEMQMGKNTIMALTMSDRLLEYNVEDLLLKRITNKSDELEGLDFAGYFAVANRQHTNTISLQDHDVLEEKFFNDNIISNISDCMPTEIFDAIKNNVTIKNLMSKINQISKCMQQHMETQ